MRLIGRGIVIGLCVMACVVALSLHTERVSAMNLLVKNCLDDGSADSLRVVLGTAVSGDSIGFNQDCTGAGAITLGSTLTLTQDVTIDGVGHSVAVQAAATPNSATYGVFIVDPMVTASIANLTIANGNATNGGGILNGGTLTVTNSTLSGNSAGGGFGGGIENFGTLTVTNSTFAGNRAINNGGGIFNNSGGTLTVTNTIVAGNTGGDLGGTPAATTSHNNLIGGTPLLAALGTYGGPTQTIALLPGSPAIDKGDDTVCTQTTGTAPVNKQDQRGITRPVGAHCDIGAFESRGFTLTKTSGDNQTAVVGTAFTNPLVVTLASAFNEPLGSAAITFTAIPNAGASATITGSPATITASGMASVTARANMTVGSYGVTASVAGAPSVTFSLTNTAPTITLAPTTLPGGVKGVAYPPTTLTAAGGTAPFTFAVTTGTLPTGLTLSPSGVLSGTPSATGTFPFTVQATDANGFTGSQPYTITVTAAPLTGITLTPPSGAGNPPSVKVGQTEQFTAMGTYADGSTQNLTSQVQWTSSNPKMAMVDTTGKVTGESPGTVTITATLNGVAQTITVTVGGPTPIGITVQPAPASRPSGAAITSPGAPPPAPIPKGR